MPTQSWVSTLICCEPLQKAGLARLNEELAQECQQLREFYTEGRNWSKRHFLRV